MLRAIMRRVERLQTIVPPVLKAICFFFPRCSLKLNAPSVTMTSSLLIDRLEHCGAFYDVVVPCPLQLSWILKSDSAAPSTKFALLEMWLREEEHANVLCNVLQSCEIEGVLLEYIRKFPTNDTSKR